MTDYSQRDSFPMINLKVPVAKSVLLLCQRLINIYFIQDSETYIYDITGLMIHAYFKICKKHCYTHILEITQLTLHSM